MYLSRYLLLLPVLLSLPGSVHSQPSRQSPAEERDSLRRLITFEEGAKERFRLALRVYESLDTKDSLIVSRYEDTLRSYESELPPGYFAGHYHFELTKTAKSRNDVPQAKQELSLALAGFMAYDSTEMAAMRGRAHQMGSTLGLMSQDYDYGYDHAREAVRLFRGLLPEEEDNLAGTLNNLGTILQKNGLFEEAFPSLRESAARYARLKRPERLFHPLNNIGSQYSRMDQLDSAEFYFREAVRAVEAQPRPNPGQLAYVWNNLSGVYERQGRLELALTTVRPAIQVFRDLGAKRELATVAGSTGGLLMNLNRPEEAVPMLREALEAGNGFPAITEHVENKLTEAFILLGEPDSARHHFKTYRTMVHERTKKRTETALADAEGKFQNRQKQLEIEQLEAAELLSQERIERQRLTIGGILVVLGLLGFLLYQLYGQRRQITRQNRTITKSLADKEVLLKEIHHRVKNNLQMVSSLLSLQSRYVADDTAVAALRMGNSRVRSMALIHQKLYLRDEVTTAIGTREYLEKLLNELVGNLTETGKPVSVFADIEEVEVDIDTMIPLGLIANELITNSLKYAFTGRDHGHLEMLLTRMGDRLRVTFRDDGIGLQHDPSREPTSFGYLLINSLVEQLDGQLSVSGTSGTTVVLEVPVS